MAVIFDFEGAAARACGGLLDQDHRQWKSDHLLHRVVSGPLSLATRITSMSLPVASEQPGVSLAHATLRLFRMCPSPARAVFLDRHMWQLPSRPGCEGARNLSVLGGLLLFLLFWVFHDGCPAQHCSYDAATILTVEFRVLIRRWSPILHRGASDCGCAGGAGSAMLFFFFFRRYCTERRRSTYYLHMGPELRFFFFLQCTRGESFAPWSRPADAPFSARL